MNFAQTLNKIMNTANISAYKISKDTGISDRLIGYWKKGDKLPGAENLLMLANYFGISVDYLLTGKEKSSPTDLTADEQELLTYYKSLTEREKGIVLGRAEVLSELHKTPTKETKNTIFIEYYSLPVSAGTGVYLDGCEKDMLEVEETALTTEANFALRVSGNSMEPVYHDGDMVLIAANCRGRGNRDIYC